MTGAGWQSAANRDEREIPERHWHLNDPGVVPNLLQTGAGSPTGITVYEGDLLPMFQWSADSLRCRPECLPRVLVTDDGAGYSAEIVTSLTGTRDKWFRPSDVKSLRMDR